MEQSTKQMRCPLASLNKLTSTVYQVILSVPETVKFKAGQYALVVMGKQDKRPFSIASSPTGDQQIELHIGATADNRYAMDVIEQVQQHQYLDLELPVGEAFYRDDSKRSMSLIAGGTGFSYAWSILQAHIESSSDRPVTLYWGARSKAELYFDAKLRELSAQYAHVHYRPVVEQADEDWTDATGLVHRAVLAEQDNLADADVYVAGRFEMVRVIRDDFHAQGLPLTQLYGDALSFI